VKRTIAIKLNITENQHLDLFQLQKTFSGACQAVAEIADKEKEINRVRLHHLSYYTLRQRFPEIGSQMSCNAIAKVANALKALKKKRKINFKENASIHFDKRTYSLKEKVLSLFTLQGRIKIPLEICPFHASYINVGTFKEAELVRKGNQWFFNLVLEIPEPVQKQSGKILAVDFGENNMAATSSGKLFGGGAIKDHRDKFLAHRRRLQSNGSQSAKQRLKRISGKEGRRVKHVNHVVAKEIIDEAIKNECKTIVLEDLKNIRERIRGNKKMRSRLHRWSFDELRRFVEYKAQAKGIEVVYVNPAYTSQTCSKCSSHGSRCKHRFVCPNCGSQQHSDLNASQNLLRLAMSADIATGEVNRRNVAA